MGCASPILLQAGFVAKPFFVLALARPRVTNSADDLWHMHRRRCQNPTQLWLPKQNSGCRDRRRGRFPRFPVGVAIPRQPHSPRPGTRGRVLHTCSSGRAPHLGSCREPPAPWGRRSAADPRRGGGVGRRAGIGGPAGAQVSSFINTRTGRPRGQRPSSQRRRRQTRRCHCRCHLRVTTGSPVRPGPPKSTPLSISGAPRRSSSLRGLTVGCSFHTRPWSPSERPGKPLGERAYPRLTSPDLFHSGYPDPRVLSTLGLDRPLSEEGKGPGSASRGRNVTGSKEGTVVVAVNERVSRCFWFRPSASEKNLCPPV